MPAPLQGTIVVIGVAEGDLVRAGQQIAVIESMKMEHLVVAPYGGRVTKVAAGPGVTLMNKAVYDKLSRENQDAIVRAANRNPPAMLRAEVRGFENVLLIVSDKNAGGRGHRITDYMRRIGNGRRGSRSRSG